jgi:ABC-type spermidine/putrescine transport system, permease component II
MNSKKKKRSKILTPVILSLVYLFLYLPIFIVVLFSFNTSRMNITFQGFTLNWYATMFQNTDLMSALLNTVIVAVSCVVLSVFIGTLAAIGMFRYKFKVKGFIDALMYIPIVIPEIVMGISLLVFFSMIQLQTGLITLIIAHVTFSTPYVCITVRSRIAGYDMSVEEAAMDLGASPLHTLTKVTLPIIAPGIMSGAMLALTLSLDDVIVSFFTTGVDSVTLPIYIFNKVKTGVTPDVNALSTVIILVTLLILLVSNFIGRRTNKKRGL